MLNPATDPAQGFLANTQVRSDMTQEHSFEYMWSLLQQVFITFGGSFEMSIHKTLFQPYIIFFVSDPYEPLNFMVMIKKSG